MQDGVMMTEWNSAVVNDTIEESDLTEKKTINERLKRLLTTLSIFQTAVKRR